MPLVRGIKTLMFLDQSYGILYGVRGRQSDIGADFSPVLWFPPGNYNLTDAPSSYHYHKNGIRPTLV